MGIVWFAANSPAMRKAGIMPNKSGSLLFVDTNIWLDFYRTRSDAGLELLTSAENAADRIIVTYQLESEFKKNRQAAIVEGMQELKAPPQIPRPGLFSDAQATKMMARSIKDAEKRVKYLRARFLRAIENPTVHDPVYQACQRVFHKSDDLVLSRQDKVRHVIRRSAFRRFLHGCPPRKKTDTSIGDALNWEWIIHCAIARNANVVIVSRDADYGVTIDNKSYINDHLKQEFSERVSKKGKVTLHNRLSEALKQLQVSVSKQQEEAEKEIVGVSKESNIQSNLAALSAMLNRIEPLPGLGISNNPLAYIAAMRNDSDKLYDAILRAEAPRLTQPDRIELSPSIHQPSKRGTE